MNGRGSTHRAIFLTICSMYVKTTFGTNHINVSLPLPKDWDEYCPYTNFCTHNALKAFSFSKSKKPCCDSCSCEEDCGLYRNCCHYSMDIYRLDETYKTRCQSLTTGREDENLYYIIDHCPNSTSCHIVRAANWGSMYPVSSNANRMIYMNEQCAICNGETLFTKWDMELNCEAEHNHDMPLSTAIENVLRGNGEIHTCFIKFIPPATIDMAFQRCTLTPIFRECYTEHPFDLETQELCKSYNATYFYNIGGIKFANIHCFLCHSPRRIFTLCDADYANRFVSSKFTFLLSPRKIAQITQKNNKNSGREGGCNHNEIKEKQTGICRRIRCPILMTELDGKCSYVSDIWTAGPFWSVIKLQTIDEPVAISREDIKAEGTQLFDGILKGWSKELFIDKNSSHVDFINIRLRHRRKKVNIKDFLNSIQFYFDNFWNISIKGQKIQMKASFNNFFWDIEYKGLVNPLSEDEFSPDVEELGIPFTKFYMCNQVDLNPDEYEQRGTQLFLKITNETFDKIEYRKLTFPDSSDKVSLCVYDFGADFWVQPSSANNIGRHTYFLSGFLLILIYSCVAKG